MNKKILCALSALCFSHSTYSVTANGFYCSGRIAEVIKWSQHTNASVLLEGSKRYFSLPSKVEESMVLLAYASGKEVTITWNSSSGVAVTNCIEDWPHYKTLDGFIVLK
ncbi:hypothetical protein [Teredinibacter sp. KSP-S5-2]|uniref:hypothetical protein n=1 Tax=Teredinibacter sp. KSP-S5-2 TaxID=3034506 RepID=UPI0029341BE7|nr:hypothetical protein [Teredinibacter sp. KSP-S5-2]WNO08665.1 hypothetical protein P5V12_16970 [Teredinibacter sp. KSP-S5-2]